jgi:LAS superfamily LD-carboxypeptidase LdcB
MAAPSHAASPSPTPTPSASTTTTTIIDYCGSSKSGKVRAITTGKCQLSERSLGAEAIKRGKHRPKHLVTQFYNRYKTAKAAARKAGYTLQITSGWRSLSHQKYLYDRAVKRYGGDKKLASHWVLPPKKSNHPWGIAVDVNYGAGSKKGAKWLEKNGYKFGMCRRYKNEWWHFEPLVAPGTKCPKMEPFAS